MFGGRTAERGTTRATKLAPIVWSQDVRRCPATPPPILRRCYERLLLFKNKMKTNYNLAWKSSLIDLDGRGPRRRATTAAASAASHRDSVDAPLATLWHALANFPKKSF